MSTLFLDGFDHYGITPPGQTFPYAFNGPGLNMLDGTWAQVDGAGTSQINGFLVTTPYWGSARTGAGCLHLIPAQGAGIGLSVVARKVFASSQSVLFARFGFAIDNLPTTTSPQIIMDFRDGSNNVLWSLGLNTTGQAILYNGAQSTVNAVTSGPVFRSQTWHFIELQVDTAGGQFILRVDDAAGNGTAAITTSITTGTNIAQIAVGQYATASSANVLGCYWDDLFINNASGSYNNGFMGDRRIATLYPNADSTPMGWTPSYYKEFGSGILTLGYVVPNTSTIQNSGAFVSTAAATALDIGNADFTLETMVRFDALPAVSTYSTIFGRWDAANNKRSYRLILGGSSYNNGSIQFDTTTDGTTSTLATPIVYPWVPQTNTWYHVALVRAAGELLLFINGQQMGVPIADSRTYYSDGSELFSVGAEITGTGAGTVVTNTGLNGRLDETRFTNGVGRYTSTFTPPASAFTRGSGDANWTYVVLLCGYNGSVVDESSFARTLFTSGGAVSFSPQDGPGVGVFSTVNKSTPDDNTFIAATLVNATNVLTMTSQPTNGDTVTVGTKNGSTAAVYTFKTALSTAFDILIDTVAQGTLTNLYNAINAGSGIGTKYGTGTTANFDVNAIQLPAGQIEVSANVAGTGGNSIASTATGFAASWLTSTLTGGSNIPSASNFKFQRPPPNTTLVSALQTVVRGLKTDAGSATIQTALIGPLAGSVTGATHNLATSPDYYTDIIETDPDTSGGLTPTTIVNGKFQINRTA